jgi:hypothetical protein
VTKGRILFVCAILLAMILGVTLRPQAEAEPADAAQTSSPSRVATDTTNSPDTTVGTSPQKLAASNTAPESALANQQPQREENQRTTPQPRTPVIPDVPETTEADQSLRSSLSVRLKKNEVLVTGGYADDQGRLRYAVSRHSIVRFLDQPPQIKLQTQMFAIQPEQAEKYGLDSLLTAADDTNQHGEIWTSDEYTRIVGELSGSADSAIMSSPTIQFLPEHEAFIQTGNYRVKVVADNVDDDDGVNMELSVEQPRDQ